MSHVSDGVLRARFDGELGEADLPAVERHLSTCAACRARADRMASSAEAIHALFSRQAAVPDETGPDVAEAFARFQNRRKDVFSERVPFWSALAARMRVPAWVAIGAVAVVALLVASPPTRAVARKLLGVFRAKTVVAVPMDHDFVANGKGQIISDLLSSSTTVTLDEQPRDAANVEEAALLAGFAPRLPAIRSDPPRILRVEGAHKFYLTADRKRVESFAELVGRPDLRLPPELAGAKVMVDIPRGVRAVYGECPDVPAAMAQSSRLTSCLDFLQVPSATVTTLPELDLAQLAEIGLELTGMTQAQAQSFGRTVDWTSTLAIALPRESARFDEVTVDGQRAVLIVGRQYLDWPTRWALIWVGQERVYSLSGFGDPQSALQVAGSLR